MGFFFFKMFELKLVRDREKKRVEGCGWRWFFCNICFELFEDKKETSLALREKWKKEKEEENLKQRTNPIFQQEEEFLENVVMRKKEIFDRTHRMKMVKKESKQGT